MIKFGFWPITEAEADCWILKDIYSPLVLFVGLSNLIKSFNRFFYKTMWKFELILIFNPLGAGTLGLRIKPGLFWLSSKEKDTIMGILWVYMTWFFCKTIGLIVSHKTSAVEAEGRLSKSFVIGRLCSALVIVWYCHIIIFSISDDISKSTNCLWDSKRPLQPVKMLFITLENLHQ